MKADASRVAEIVKAALECDATEWSAFLEEACGGDETLRTEVASLLRFHEEASDFIETPALHLAAKTFVSEASIALPRVIAGYRVLSKIGEGGMGNVYLAEDVELRRQVALKLVRPSVSTAEIAARFRHEEQILASLNHPNIAQLYGVGTAEDGAPFFVMEHVAGARVDEFCRRENLTTRERLQLFRKVCAAVHYAHQHLVIHRDLKPSNILVTESGEPKLLDFGIAKLLDPKNLPAAHAPTLVGVMTPDYASSEQVRGEEITTASDVYSLGVILYELLTEARPYRTKSRRPEEIARAVTEEEPARPSTAAAADNPQSQIANRKSLRGDLDNIVLMALRKEPARRYTSAAQFSEDIRRHLEGLPVIARKDTFGYRSSKFVRRNKVAVAAAAVVFLTLIGGIIATTWQAKKALTQARIAAEQRDRAQKQAVKAERVTAFMQNVLGFSDPGWASSNPNRKRDATISEAMVEAGRRAETELANEPEALAAVHFTIGNTYRTQSRYPEAEPHLRASLDLRRRVLGDKNPETAQSMVAVAEWCILNAKLPEAESLYLEAIPIFRAADDAKWLSIALSDYSVLKSATGDYAFAERILREGLEISAGLAGPDRAPRAIMYSSLGTARAQQGDMVKAGALLEKSIEEFRALPGEPRSELAFALNTLGNVRLIQGDYDKAESLLREAFELFRKTVGENHQNTAGPLIVLAELYYKRQDYERARSEIEHARRIQQAALPADHIDLTWSRLTLGKILTQTGALEEAERSLRAVLEKVTPLLPHDHPNVAAARGALGECLVLQKRYAEAEPLLLDCEKVFRPRFGPNDPRTRTARERLVKLYEAWSRPEEAARFR